MLEGSAAERFSREELLEQDGPPHPTRWPVAWLLLKPLTKQGAVHQRNSTLLVLPLRIDIGLPDYLTSRKEYVQSMELRWEVGQRFQMFFASKSKAKGRAGCLHERSLELSANFSVQALKSCLIFKKMLMHGLVIVCGMEQTFASLHIHAAAI